MRLTARSRLRAQRARRGSSESHVAERDRDLGRRPCSTTPFVSGNRWPFGVSGNDAGSAFDSAPTLARGLLTAVGAPSSSWRAAVRAAPACAVRLVNLSMAYRLSDRAIVRRRTFPRASVAISRAETRSVPRRRRSRRARRLSRMRALTVRPADGVRVVRPITRLRARSSIVTRTGGESSSVVSSMTARPRRSIFRARRAVRSGAFVSPAWRPAGGGRAGRSCGPRRRRCPSRSPPSRGSAAWTPG